MKKKKARKVGTRRVKTTRKVKRKKPVKRRASTKKATVSKARLKRTIKSIKASIKTLEKEVGK